MIAAQSNVLCVLIMINYLLIINQCAKLLIRTEITLKGLM